MLRAGRGAKGNHEQSKYIGSARESKRNRYVPTEAPEVVFNQMTIREPVTAYYDVGPVCSEDELAEWIADADEAGLVGPGGFLRDPLDGPTILLDRGGRCERGDRGDLCRSERMRQAVLIGGKLSAEDWELILEAFGGCCAYCGIDGVRLTRDHMVPIARGGLDMWRNVVPACRSCNSSKHKKDVLEWLDELGMASSAMARLEAGQSKAARLRRERRAA